MDLPLGVVLGTFGVERHAVRFRGQHAHSGSTPMDVRRDAFIAAARSVIEFRDDAARRDDVRGTVGSVNVRPGIVTALNGWCEVSLEQRALDAGVLADMLETAKEASERVAGEGDGAVDADGDALRKEPQGPQPHQRRGHAGGGSGAVGTGTAPACAQDYRLGGERVTAASETKS